MLPAIPPNINEASVVKEERKEGSKEKMGMKKMHGVIGILYRQMVSLSDAGRLGIKVGEVG